MSATRAKLRRHLRPAPSVKVVYDGHMDKLKKVAITVALFVAVWALAAFWFGVLLAWTDYTSSPWWVDALGCGLGVGVVTVYERIKEL